MKTSFTKWIDCIGLLAIAGVTAGYVYWGAIFAEMHIQFSFLNFPVFVGEWLLIGCTILFGVKIARLGFVFNKWIALCGLYFGFVLLKAGIGYAEWGPLAFRHAALMYYPFFAVLGYTFFQREYMNKWVVLISMFVILAILYFGNFYVYYMLTLFVAGVILLKAMKTNSLRAIFAVLFLVLIPYNYFYDTARMMILAHLVFTMYALLIGFCLIKLPLKIKSISAMLIFVLVFGAMVQYAGWPRIRSIFDVPNIMRIYKEYEEVIRDKMNNFEFQSTEQVQLFNSNKDELELARQIMEHEAQEKIRKQQAQQDLVSGQNLSNSNRFGNKLEDANLAPNQAVTPLNVSVDSAQVSEESVEEVNEIAFVADANNSVFRLFIWRDMWVEFMQHKPILGFDYGKPLRSKSLESIRWAESEWKRDGWVSAHNSFFHILYRSGIFGLLALTCLFAYLFKMVLGFLDFRSMTGLLLCGLILSWMVAANFLVVLEVPYTAIPIWTLYGITVAFYREKQLEHMVLVKESV